VIQCSEQIKPSYNYSYDSLDHVVSSVSVLEPLEMEDEENGEKINKSYHISKLNPGSIEISNNKLDREIVTSPVLTRDVINKKKYFPTQSYDQVLDPEVERKDSYYEYDQNEQNECSIDRKYSDYSLVSSIEPSLSLNNRNEFERTRAYSMSAMCSDICTNPIMASGSERETVRTTSTTATGEFPTHPHHHHHFFIISNSEADIPSSSQIKCSYDNINDGNCSTRTVISSRQHRKFDITTSSISSKAPSIATTNTKTTNSCSTTSLFKHKRSPSNSSNQSSHSRFTIIRESSSKNVNNEKSPLSSNSSTIKKPSRFTVTRNAIN